MTENDDYDIDDVLRQFMASTGTTQNESSTEELGEDCERCAHFDGGSEFDEPVRLRTIARLYPEHYTELENIADDLVGRYVRAVMRESFSNTRRYMSLVIPYRDDQHRERMVQRLADTAIGYPGRILLYVDEGDHIHIVHDCPYSNGQCRCYFQKTPDFRGPLRGPMRQCKYISDLDRIDWTNVFLYFVVSKWKRNPQVWIGGRLQRPTNHDESIRWKHMQDQSAEILRRQVTGISSDSLSQVGHREDRGSLVSTSTSKTAEKRSLDSGGPPRKKSKFQRIHETVSSLLEQHLVIPADHIRDLLVGHPVSQTLFDPCNEKAYQAACELYTRKFISFSLIDLYNFYNDKNCLFYANDLDYTKYYHDIDTSVRFISDLLRYQYDDEEDKIKELLNNIRDWFNRKGWDNNPKINCICIVGPPNSGKNYFWDMLAALAYNVGHIGRVNNKTNQFALQECHMRRLVMGNEISMEDGAKEDMKKICEGTACNIRKKYQGDKVFTKTPVCLIANYMLDICYDPTFKDVRLHTIKWSTYEGLRESNKKPYPLAFFKLYDLYNVSLQ